MQRKILWTEVRRFFWYGTTNFPENNCTSLWGCQQSKRPCKTRVMLPYHPKQGNRRSHKHFKMLLKLWVSCHDRHLKLSSWCEFWRQVLKEFCRNFYVFLLTFCTATFFAGDYHPFTVALAWRSVFVAVESSSFFGGHAGGRGFRNKRGRWHHSGTANCWKNLAVAEGKGWTHCWQGRVKLTIKRRSFTELHRFLKLVRWSKDCIWGSGSFDCGCFWYEWGGPSECTGRHFLSTLDRKRKTCKPSFDSLSNCRHLDACFRKGFLPNGLNFTIVYAFICIIFQCTNCFQKILSLLTRV